MKPIEFENACKMAYDYFKKELGTEGLLKADDLGDRWLFGGGEPDVVMFGIHSITVDKKTGELETFILPDKENFKLLKKAKQIEVPNDYKAS